MNSPQQLDGCRILNAPADWQILQRNGSGFASVTLAGKWSVPPHETADPLDRKEPFVVVRVVQERTGIPASESLDWQPAKTNPDGTWEAQLEIPAGGLYRIETGIHRGRIEWLYHGDTIHHIGVGDLWVIAGQSNAAGYGRGYIDDPVELGIHLLGNDEQWQLATHPLNDTRRSRHANLEQCNPRHSPFLAFGRLLKSELGLPIGLVQTALGGSPLKEWNPVENPKAPLYQNLLHCIRLAGGKVAGVAWYQGESDADPERAPTYLKRFGQFVESLRRDLDQPALPFVTTQLNRVVKSTKSPTEDSEWSMIREAQRQAVREMKGVALVSTIDLPISDLIHISPAGNLILGQRLALAALEITSGKSRNARFPEIVRAFAEPDRKVIVLEFAPITHRLVADLNPVQEFLIEDEKGTVTVTVSEFPRRDQIRLTLERALTSNAVIHGQYGINPVTQVYEVEANKPLLAFYAFPIEI